MQASRKTSVVEIISIVISVIAVAIAVIAIFAAYHIFYLSRPLKKLVVSYTDPTALVSVSPEAANEIEIYYKGEPVKSLTSLNVIIQNRGNEVIEVADYQKPINISIDREFQIVSARIEWYRPGGVDAIIDQINSTAIEVRPTLLNPGDEFSIELILLGNLDEDDLNKIRVEGRVVGVSAIDVQLPSNQRPTSGISGLFLLQILAIISAGISIVYLFSLPLRGPITKLTTQLIRADKASLPLRGGLFILRAIYGANDTWVDVTEILRSEIKDNRLVFHIHNNELGGDPVENVVKHLQVEYKYLGIKGNIVKTEAETLILPPE